MNTVQERRKRRRGRREREEERGGKSRGDAHTGFANSRDGLADDVCNGRANEGGCVL